ncbi:MAG: hypothetical protein J6A76_06705 [Oscillospiraceae bacterium]|nr:hypothetical protein [Oscillospiraceae bacterium]
MKAVVLQNENGKTAVLTRDGIVRIVPDRGYTVGEELAIPRTNVIRLSFKAACAAAAVIICFMGGYLYLAPYSYVSVDINPSIEYTLNRFDRVLSVRALNDDGAEIIGEIEPLEVFNKPVEEAVELTVEKLCESEYVDQTQENVILVAAASEDEQKSQQIAQAIEDDILADEDEADIRKSVMINSVSVSPKRLREAKRMGVTAGRLQLVETLAEEIAESEIADESVEFSREEWLKKPVREVVREIDRQRKKAEPEVDENIENRNDRRNEQSENRQERPEIPRPERNNGSTGERAESRVQREEERQQKAEQREAEKQQRTEQRENRRAEKQNDKSRPQSEKRGESESPKQNSNPRREKDQKQNNKS